MISNVVGYVSAPSAIGIIRTLISSTNYAFKSEPFGTLTLFAILISCLGLFGLVSFTVANRTEELGIRKVFGATAAQIVALVLKDFIALVVVVMAISTSVTFFPAQQWLDST